MDKDGSLQIDWDEWRMFHLLNPHAHNIKHIIRFWRHSTVSFLVLVLTFDHLYCTNIDLFKFYLLPSPLDS